MIWDLTRTEKGKGYTAGVLYFGGSKLHGCKERCDTLEPQWRDYEHGEKKVKGKSAIKAGIYEVILTYSVRFKRVLPILLNVEDFEGVRIHRGNTAKDTAACILPGVSGGRGSGYVTNSTAAEKKIVAMLQECFNQGERVWLRIEENWK